GAYSVLDRAPPPYSRGAMTPTGARVIPTGPTRRHPMATQRASFRGAITALVTPMRGGAVDYPPLARLVEEQMAAGIDGVVAVGTTGESATLTVAEHVAVIK